MSGAVRQTQESGSDRLRVLVLEPYYGGSHRAVLDGLLERLDVDFDLLTLPARKWKWRMRGAAITMAAQTRSLHAEWAADELGARGESAANRWDLIYASTFVNLAEFYGLAADCVAGIPSIVYFHENQFAYPNRHVAEWDFQFPLTNITSALAATRCVFNTRFTLETLLNEVEPFLKQFPDHHPKGVRELIEDKSSVLAPPFDPTPFDQALGGMDASTAPRGARPRIVWPHRWEHDKNPDTFFLAMARLVEEGLDFEVAIAGQAFQDIPESILVAKRTLGDRLTHIGEPEDRAAYASLLAGADVAVSTASNEFFGLAMIEATYAGCYPLVPDRLAYSELYPEQFRYSGDEQLAARLRSVVGDRPTPGQGRVLAEQYTFERLIPAYADLFGEVAQGARS